ncbi:hypothetical protein BDR06DRAFT_968235 [Suillus hirtellus]|nr:hypothetical protein BDR06DRAFT_968235 [Suillus hirtellus]
MWNAFMRQKLNKANKGLTTGEWWKLPAFIAAHCAELMGEYCWLLEAAKNALRHNISVFHEGCIKIVHLNPKHQRTNITSHTGVEGFYVAVHGDIEHFHEVKIFCTPKAQSFVKEVLNLDPKCFALKFESWVTGDFDNCVDAMQRLSSTKLISMCQKSIQEGLDRIVQKHKLSQKKIKMNYDNHEQKIVKTYRIELEGWTYKTLQNPGKIGQQEDLMTLLDALVNSVAVHKESNCQCKEQGKAVYKHYKVTKKAASGPKSKELISDTDTESDSSR